MKLFLIKVIAPDIPYRPKVYESVMSELLFEPKPLEPDPRFGSKFREFAGPNLRPQVRSKFQAKASILNLNRTFALYVDGRLNAGYSLHHRL